MYTFELIIKRNARKVDHFMAVADTMEELIKKLRDKVHDLQVRENSNKNPA